MKKVQVLTVDVQFIALLSAPSHTGHLAGVLAGIWRLRPRDLQVVASLDVLSLSVGQDGLSVSVPGDGRKWHSTCLTLQCYHRVQKGCDLCGYVTTFDGRWHWRNGTKMIKCVIQQYLVMLGVWTWLHRCAVYTVGFAQSSWLHRIHTHHRHWGWSPWTVCQLYSWHYTGSGPCPQDGHFLSSKPDPCWWPRGWDRQETPA